VLIPNSVAMSPLTSILINPVDPVTASPNALVQRVLTRMCSTHNPLSVIQRSSLGKTLGRERMHFKLELAVAKYLAAPESENAA
jgi:hypothetical protein